MQTSFFNHPLWRKFQNRPIFVVCASDIEHRLRDAKAHMRLREFLPPSDSGRCTFSVQTVHEGRAPWPESSIPADAGIIVLGRPALYGPKAEAFFEKQVSPSLGYMFSPKDSRDPARYRTIEAKDAETPPFACPSFEDQRNAGQTYLFDYGLVYSGWQGKPVDKMRPVMLLAGTSTLGTWGAAEYVTEEVHGDDVRWQEDIQGLVRAEAENAPEAFDKVKISVLEWERAAGRRRKKGTAERVREMLAPCRIWMEGGDLPRCSRAAWIQAHDLKTRETGKGRPHKLRIYINGHEIQPNHRTYIPPLTLLELANRRTKFRFPGGFSCAGTASEICQCVRTFLNQPADWNDLRFSSQVYGMLAPLIGQIRRAGGIASISERRGGDDKAEEDKPEDEGAKRFELSIRELPFFLRIP